jgi:hypothetical protein
MMPPDAVRHCIRHCIRYCIRTDVDGVRLSIRTKGENRDQAVVGAGTAAFSRVRFHPVDGPARGLRAFVARRTGVAFLSGDDLINLTTLFEKIADKPKQREESRIEDFRSLVTAIVAGKQPDPERVEAVLAASGQTLDDIRAAVELRHRRIALKATLDTAPKLEAEWAKLREHIGKGQDLLDAAGKKFAETTNPLR